VATSARNLSTARTAKPALCRRTAIGSPIAPTPTNPHGGTNTPCGDGVKENAVSAAGLPLQVAAAKKVGGIQAET